MSEKEEEGSIRKKSDNFKRWEGGFWREKERARGRYIKNEESNLVGGGGERNL